MFYTKSLSRYLCSVFISPAFFKSLIAPLTVSGGSFMSPAVLLKEKDNRFNLKLKRLSNKSLEKSIMKLT